MNPALFTFEVDKLYPSLKADAFATLLAIEQAPRNRGFLEHMASVAERFAPGSHPSTREISAVKKRNFCLGTIAAFEAFTDARLGSEIQEAMGLVIAKQVLMITVRPLSPDDVYRGLFDRSTMGFAAHPELEETGGIILTHLEERTGDRKVAEAGLVGLGFAGQLIGSSYQTVVGHAGIRGDVQQTEYIDQEWAEVSAAWSAEHLDDSGQA